MLEATTHVLVDALMLRISKPQFGLVDLVEPRMARE